MQLRETKLDVIGSKELRKENTGGSFFGISCVYRGRVPRWMLLRGFVAASAVLFLVLLDLLLFFVVSLFLQ